MATRENQKKNITRRPIRELLRRLNILGVSLILQSVLQRTYNLELFFFSEKNVQQKKKIQKNNINTDLIQQYRQ